MTQNLQIKPSLWIGAQLTVFLLLIIWQIPGTIGLRYALLGLLLPMSMALCFWKSQSSSRLNVRKAPLFWLILLTGWIMVVIGLWGVDTALSWKEFRGQWLSALCAGLIGGFLAGAALRDSWSRIQSLIMTVFWVLFVQVLLHDLLGAVYWATTGEMPFRQAPVLYLPDLVGALTQGKPWLDTFSGHSPDKFSYVNNTLAALLVAEVSQRLLCKNRWLACSTATLVLGFAAMLLCSYWLQMRNGNVGLLLLLVLASLMLAIRMFQRIGPIPVIVGALGVMIGLSALGYVMLRSDARWQKLVQTIPVALDTETHRVWLLRDNNYPLMADGETVDISAYERLAWGKEGVKLIADNPMGTGYNRNAFGDGVDRKYEQQGKARGGHAHSGVVDFAIANGIVGLGLWLCFLVSIFYAGWQAFRGNQVALGLTIMFLVSGFAGRSIVDSNIRDHVLQQFLFMVTMFYGFTASHRERVPHD